MAKKKGLIGRFERPGERQYTLRRLLMAHYWHNPQFMADLSAVMEKWREALAQDIARWRRDADLPGGASDKPILGPPAYQKQLAALAERWGLRCPWAFPWLHYCLVMHLMVGAPDSRLCPIMLNLDTISANLERTRNKKTIRIEVEYHPWPPILFGGPPRLAPQKAIDEAIQQVKWQIGEIDDEYLGQGYVRRDTEPELMNHVRWLYHRIALKKVPRQIALEESVGQDAVEKAIYQLARALSLRLPRNRGASVRR